MKYEKLSNVVLKFESAFHQLDDGSKISKYVAEKVDQIGGIAEIVWNDTKNELVTDSRARGTYNYGVPSGFGKLTSWGAGYTHGRYDMKPFFRQHGQQPWYWRLQVGKNYGFNSGGR